MALILIKGEKVGNNVMFCVALDENKTCVAWLTSDVYSVSSGSVTVCDVI